jgi:hypothetical protein
VIFDITDPTVFTRVWYRDRYVLVGLSEEELFRSVMGDRRFDQAVQDAYRKDEETRLRDAKVEPRFRFFR